jgi:hypothetical protein
METDVHGSLRPLTTSAKRARSCHSLIGARPLTFSGPSCPFLEGRESDASRTSLVFPSGREGFRSRGESIVTRTRFRRCPSPSRPSRSARVFTRSGPVFVGKTEELLRRVG